MPRDDRAGHAVGAGKIHIEERVILPRVTSCGYVWSRDAAFVMHLLCLRVMPSSFQLLSLSFERVRMLWSKAIVRLRSSSSRQDSEMSHCNLCQGIKIKSSW